MQASLSPGDFPANPLSKEGYQLEFHDEFEGPTLDTQKWLPYYLPQWSSREQAATNYVFADNRLILQIAAEQEPWCPEFDGENRCSCVQSGLYAGGVGSPIGQSRFNPACVVREAQTNVRLYTPQYGYFEMRARGVDSLTDHVALWMIGYEDDPEKSAEICIFEIMGEHVKRSSSHLGYGLHPWSDPTIHDEFFEEHLPIDATRYHIYAAEWTPTHVDFYLDNQQIRRIKQSPAYSMQFMLGIFELPHKATSGAFRQTGTYPKQFVVDYFRAYQPIGGYLMPR